MTTWFITGASDGIGRQVTERLLARGDRVAATARRPHRLDDLAAAFPGLLWTAALDVSDPAAIRTVVDRAFAELTTIDVIFSNAGRAAFGAAEELTDATVADQIAVNMTGPIHLVRAVLPHLRAQGGGRIIQNSSMGAQISSPGGSLYHAAKWGLEGFLESVIGEVAPFGIGVTMVEPGTVRTGFGAAMTIAPGLDAYAGTPVGQIRRSIEGSGGNLTGAAPGDPARVAAAIIDAASATPAPRRLVLGSDAYQAVHTALTTRLTELRAGEHLAATTDFPS
ncbi:SDR family oxidoreductase [Actinoplanes awajinensis]|nr:SDR family oxidoreductase [Actinoplanes awajinensis]